MNKKQRKENANKGFSLVELIIVVAIMAVLVVAVGPQYLKFVEKSRESADLDAYRSVMDALEIHAADATVAAADRLTAGTIAFSTTAAASATTTNASTVLSKYSVDLTKIKMQSVNYGNATLTISVNADNVPTFTIACTDATKSAALAEKLQIGVTP